MKFAIFLPFLLTSSFLHAEENTAPVTKEAVSIISKINTNKIIETPCPTCTTEAPKNLKALFNKCATDLCGPASKNKTVWVTDTNFSASTPLETINKANKLNSSIEKLYSISRDKKLADIKILKKAYKDKAIDLDLYQKKAMDKKIFGPYVEEKINPDASVENRIEIKLKNTENLSPVFLSALKNYAANTAASRTSILPKNYRDIFQEKDLNSILKLNLERLQVFQKNNKWKLRKINVASSVDNIKHALEKPLSYEDFDIAMVSVMYVGNVYNAETQGFPLKAEACDAPECNQVYYQDLKIEESKNKIDDMEKWLNSSDTKSKAINKCKARMIAADIQSSDAVKAAKIFSDAKAMINQKVLPRFSEHSRKILSDYLNNQLMSNNVDIKKDLLEYKDPFLYFKAASDSYLEESKRPAFSSTTLDTYDSLQNEPEDLESFDYVKACGIIPNPILVWESFIPVEKVQAANELNPGVLPPSFTDMKDDQVFISNFSCENSDYGKHYLTHEIGHAINYIFSKGNLSESSMADYKKMRDCATSSYPASKQGTFNAQAGDSANTEEDTADLFADIASPEDTTIYTCPLLKPNFNNDAYEDLAFKGSNPADPHSTEFIRILFEVTNRNLLMPESCQQLIKTVNPDVRFKKCI